MPEKDSNDESRKWLQEVRAIKRHDYYSVSAMLREGLDPTAALAIAAGKGDSRMCELLLSAGADPDASYALDHAALYGHWRTVRLLLNRGADPRGGLPGHQILMAPVANGGRDRRAAARTMLVLEEAISELPDDNDKAFRDWWERLVARLTPEVGLDERVALGRSRFDGAQPEERALLRDGLTSMIIRRPDGWQLAARILEGHAGRDDLAKICRIAEATLLGSGDHDGPEVLALLRILAAQPGVRWGHMPFAQVFRDYPDAVAALRRCCTGEPWWEAFRQTLLDGATNYWWREEQRIAVTEALTSAVPRDS